MSNSKVISIFIFIIIINTFSPIILSDYAQSIGPEMRDENNHGVIMPYLIITKSEAPDVYLVDKEDNLFYKWQTLHYVKSYYNTDRYVSSMATNGKVSVAVGEDNLIFRSEDNYNWKVVDVDYFKNVNCNFEKVIWNGKMFLAFANSFNYYISSVDGKEWVEHPFGGTYAVHNVYQFNSKTFLICSDSVINNWYYPNAVILVSSDGKKWTKAKFKNIAETSFGTRPFSTMAYNGKFYLAAGNFGTLAKSTDGINWIGIDTSKESYKAYRNNNYDLLDQYEAYSLDFASLIWDGKRFVGSGIDRSGSKDIPRVITSKDGIKWTSLTSWDISKSSSKSNFELGWNGEFYYLTINSYEDVQPEVFNTLESSMRLTSVSISRDGSKWSKICEFTNDSAITTQIINKNFYIIGSSIYVGTAIKPDLVPENAEKISFYKTKLVKFPRIAYNIYSNPMGFKQMFCPSIDGKPLIFPKNSEPIAYKKNLESELEILYPVDIIVEHMKGKLVYDKKTGYFVAKFDNKEKFRIKANDSTLIYMKNDGSSERYDIRSFDESVPRMYNGKIYVSIHYLMTTLGYEMKLDSDYNLLGYYKIKN